MKAVSSNVKIGAFYIIRRRIKHIKDVLCCVLVLIDKTDLKIMIFKIIN